MALTKCKECGGLLSTLAKKCPHCGAPVDKEPLRPVETPRVAPVNEPQSVPEPVKEKPQLAPEPVQEEPQTVPEPSVNEEPEYDEKESHTVRNVILIVLVLLLAAAGGFYYYQYQQSSRPLSESLVERIPSSFKLTGEMAGLPISISCERDDDDDFHGTLHNLSYDTETSVEGHITDNALELSGSMEGESFDITLFKTSAYGTCVQGLCQRDEGECLFVKLNIQ